LGIGAVEKVAPSIFDRIKWQFNGTTDATIANRNGPELNENTSRIKTGLTLFKLRESARCEKP